MAQKKNNNSHPRRKPLSEEQQEEALRIAEKAAKYGLELGTEARALLEKVGRRPA